MPSGEKIQEASLTQYCPSISNVKSLSTSGHVLNSSRLPGAGKPFGLGAWLKGDGRRQGAACLLLLAAESLFWESAVVVAVASSLLPVRASDQGVRGN